MAPAGRRCLHVAAIAVALAPAVVLSVRLRGGGRAAGIDGSLLETQAGRQADGTSVVHADVARAGEGTPAPPPAKANEEKQTPKHKQGKKRKAQPTEEEIKELRLKKDKERRKKEEDRLKKAEEDRLKKRQSEEAVLHSCLRGSWFGVGDDDTRSVDRTIHVHLLKILKRSQDIQVAICNLRRSLKPMQSMTSESIFDKDGQTMDAKSIISSFESVGELADALPSLDHPESAVCFTPDCHEYDLMTYLIRWSFLLSEQPVHQELLKTRFARSMKNFEVNTTAVSEFLKHVLKAGAADADAIVLSRLQEERTDVSDHELLALKAFAEKQEAAFQPFSTVTNAEDVKRMNGSEVTSVAEALEKMTPKDSKDITRRLVVSDAVALHQEIQRRMKGGAKHLRVLLSDHAAMIRGFLDGGVSLEKTLAKWITTGDEPLLTAEKLVRNAVGALHPQAAEVRVLLQTCTPDQPWLRFMRSKICSVAGLGPKECEESEPPRWAEDWVRLGLSLDATFSIVPSLGKEHYDPDGEYDQEKVQTCSEFGTSLEKGPRTWKEAFYVHNMIQQDGGGVSYEISPAARSKSKRTCKLRESTAFVEHNRRNPARPQVGMMEEFLRTGSDRSHVDSGLSTLDTLDTKASDNELQSSTGDEDSGGDDIQQDSKKRNWEAAFGQEDTRLGKPLHVDSLQGHNDAMFDQETMLDQEMTFDLELPRLERQRSKSQASRLGGA